jgi:uncharacterized membrane protein
MTKGRIEAFSDGVLAIIITIMVLELKIPRGSDLSALPPMLPVLLSYVLSFAYVGIYWNNHHHLLHATRRISGGIMWANLHLLFWLSLVPVVTGWVGEHPQASWPTAIYGVLLFMAAIAYTVLEQAIISRNGPDSDLSRAVGRKVKEKVSGFLYAAAIGLAFVRSWAAQAIYALVALMWIVPARRIESKAAIDKEGAP